jgi:nucleoside-diphosphate-sugar epimerase
MIRLARRTGSKLCLLSTMETYGEVASEVAIREDEGGFLDAMVVRNSYPEAKRAVEALCAAHAAEYDIDALVVRLVQTFGPGVARDDKRVFAYFARCVLEGSDIVLMTTGEKRNSYLYTADAVSALLVAAACGERGRAYNAANDATYCSVLEMARLVCDAFGGGEVSVRVEVDEEAARHFRKGSNLRLDTSALQELGWQPLIDLRTMYERLLRYWEDTGQ